MERLELTRQENYLLHVIIEKDMKQSEMVEFLKSQELSKEEIRNISLAVMCYYDTEIEIVIIK